MKFVYMETTRGGGIMRLRGECKDDHDIKSHIRCMSRKGYAVEHHSKVVGKEIKNNVIVKIRISESPDEFVLKEKTVTHTEYRRGPF